MVEKFNACTWPTDALPEGVLGLDRLLEHGPPYWLTGRAGTSACIGSPANYRRRERFANDAAPTFDQAPNPATQTRRTPPVTITAEIEPHTAFSESSAARHRPEQLLSSDPGPRLLPSMRRLLYASALLVFLAGVQLFVFPTRTEDFFAWTIATPITAVFLGAAYWSAVVLEISGARARSWPQARIAVPTVFVFTSLTLAVTLYHLHKFHLGSESGPATRVVTWGWLVIYSVVPILMIIITVRQHRLRVADPPWVRRLPRLIRFATLALMVILGAAGLTLFLGSFLGAHPHHTVVPEMSAWWPWPLTPLSSGAVGAWLISLAVAAGHAAFEDDVSRIRPLGATAVVFSVLQGIALLRYGRGMDWSAPAAYGYVIVLAALLVLGLWALRAARALTRTEISK